MSPVSPEAQEIQDDKSDGGGWVLVFFVIVVLLWAATPFYFYCRQGLSFQTAGEIGDAFGAINALFSGLAFVGVLWAIHLQRQQLKEQQKEVRVTIQEQRDQAAIFKEQAEMMRLAARLAALPTLVTHEQEWAIAKMNAVGISHTGSVLSLLKESERLVEPIENLLEGLAANKDPSAPLRIGGTQYINRQAAEVDLRLYQDAKGSTDRLRSYLTNLRLDYGLLDKNK